MIHKAAAVVLLDRESPARAFLVRRSAKLRFLGGFFAFPGGVCDQGEDGEAAAIRELFEETGVLLGGGDASADELARIRRELLLAEGGAKSAPGWEALRARLKPADLIDLGRFVTPPFSPIRYDTRFFLARLPEGLRPEVWQGELTEGAFFGPAQALSAWRRGEMRIAPPVLTLLEVLAAAGEDRFPEVSRGLARAFEGGALPPVRFSPGVIMAALRSRTIPPATTTNTLIAGNEQVYVIDPGTHDPAEQERLLQLVGELQAAGRRVSGILLTHHHRDHSAGATAIARATGLKVRGHPETLARLDPDTPRGAPIDDADEIDLGTAPDGSGPFRLRALFTPGHAPGHLCYFEPRFGALIAGDMVSTLSTIVIDPPEGHMATYLTSLRRLLELDVKTLYPAHGPPAIGGRRVIEKLLSHREARERKLVECLGKGPATAEELLCRVYDDVDRALLPLAMRSLVAGIQKLEEEGRVVRDQDRHLLAAEPS